MTFLDNLKQLPKMLSFWVATIGTGLMMMPPDLQAQLYAAIPLLKSAGPLVWLATFVVARAVPQDSVKE